MLSTQRWGYYRERLFIDRLGSHNRLRPSPYTRLELLVKYRDTQFPINPTTGEEGRTRWGDINRVAIREYLDATIHALGGDI